MDRNHSRDNFTTTATRQPPQDGTAATSSPTTLAKKEEFPTITDQANQQQQQQGNSYRSMEEELQLHAEHQHNSKERVAKETAINEKESRQHQEFMDWCHNVLGIQTSLEVHTFYYYDMMTAILTHPPFEDVDTDDDDDNFQKLQSSENSSHPEKKWQDPPMIPVRGLRATRDIEQGEVVISIPYQALLTVSTTIDQDPVLSRVIGPKARQAYGWTLGQDQENMHPGNMDSVDFFELPLLAMALLHHYKLGSSSPLYPYIHLLRKSPLDSMPFLWNKQKRHQYYDGSQSSVTRGIQTVARSIRLEMKDMYHTVVDTLVRDHPDLFGKRSDASGVAGEQQYDVLDDEDWAFSFENFQWAFAMVNSRHWLLPIVDLQPNNKATGQQHTPPAEKPPSITPMMMQPQGSVDGVPPAEMPTDSWLDQNTEAGDDGLAPDEEEQAQGELSYHSFLAPVADLLNFGPPCTRGRYNPESHTFDIIASCNFTPGQEVTFWYSDECEEIIIGNYGFTHPMVPKCPTAEELRLELDKLKKRASSLQEALEDAYEDMDIMDTELQHVQQILVNCDCCDKAKAAADAAYLQQEEQSQYQQQRKQPGRQPQADVDSLQGNYLRNPQDPAPSQIRGGGGGGLMMSRSSTGAGNRANRSASGTTSRSGPGGGTNGKSRRSKEERRILNSPRGRVRSDDDDVERHGVRRMWAGRSGL